MDRDLVVYISTVTAVVAPFAATADYLLDRYLLKRKRGCRTCYLAENAVAIVAFLGLRSLLSFETLQMISANLSTTILQLSIFKALILIFLMVLHHRRSSIQNMFTLSNGLSVMLRTVTIGFASSVYVVLCVVYLFVVTSPN